MLKAQQVISREPMTMAGKERNRPWEVHSAHTFFLHLIFPLDFRFIVKAVVRTDVRDQARSKDDDDHDEEKEE